ncbi:hypothetical protein IKG10_03075 [Candidatus Saccharibacteria bacterium]|nr:hypothetical protein [Candidatus Saccharibacteria bacterium]
MNKKCRFLCAVLMLIIQPIIFFHPFLSATAISDAQETIIIKRCDDIKTELRLIQREDAKSRVHLGAYYDQIMSNFVTPLNVKLVENNLSNAGFIDNQNDLAKTKSTFANDFTKYQQMLEELVAIDCKNEPEKFYDKLVDVRQRRKTMEQDVLKMRRLISEHIGLVEKVRSKI